MCLFIFEFFEVIKFNLIDIVVNWDLFLKVGYFEMAWFSVISCVD